MLTSYTSVVERRRTVTEALHTHPYETGWALQAVFFVQTESATDGGPRPQLRVTPQMSPDGLHWLDAGEVHTLDVEETLLSVRMENFGSWLRLAILGPDASHPATVTVHLSMKG